MLRKYIVVAYSCILSGSACFRVCHLLFCRSRPILRVEAVALFFVLSLFSQCAFSALLGDTIRPYVDYEVVFDDNILRIRDSHQDATGRLIQGDPGNPAVPPVTGPILGTKKFHDISQRITGGLLFEKEISRQRLSAEGSWSRTFFDRFSSFNHNAQDVKGNWNWFLGKNLEGNMGATYERGLTPFLFLPGLKNFRNTTTQYFNADWRLHSNWGLHAGYQHFNLTNSTRFDLFGNNSLDFLDREEHIFDFGFNYYARDTNKVGVLYRHIEGDFPSSPGNNSYDQNEVRAVIDWTVFGKSWVQFSGGWVQRSNNSPIGQNLGFSGFNARMLYIWQATGKLRLALAAWRETGPINALQSRFSLNTGVSFSPSWSITEKLKLQGEVLYDERKFTGVLGSSNNNILDGSIGLVYKPYHGIQVSALAFHNQLISDTNLGDVKANGVSIGIRYTFKDYDNK